MSPDSPTPAEPVSAEPTPAWNARSVMPVWAFAILAAVLTAWLLPPALAVVWLPVGLAVSAILAFVVQLALERKEGLVDRLIASLVGALLVFAIALAVVHLLAG